MEKIDKKEKRKINLIIQVCGLLTVFLGVSAILGWISDIPQLATFAAGKIPMALSTAVLFVVYGLIIFVHNRITKSHIMSSVGVAISFIGILFTLLLLYLSLSGIRLDVEHLGIKMNGAVDGLVVGHISPVAAFCFLLVGLSILIMLKKTAPIKQIKISLILAALVFLISIIFLLSYLLGTPLLYEKDFIPPALTTSLAFLFFGIALLLIAGLKAWSYEELSNALSTRYTYILISVFILLIVSILTAGYSYYKNYEKQFRFGIEEQLSSIAVLKINDFVQWRKERLGDAEAFYHNIEFSGLVKHYISNQNNTDTKERIQKWINQVRSTNQYNRISLHDLKGRELVSSPVEKFYPSLFFSKCLSEVQKSGQIKFEDFYRDENDNRIYLTIFIPIQSDKIIIGILAMRIDPRQYLYPLINEWPTQSKTAETYLIRREGDEIEFLNELRFQKDTSGSLRRSVSNIQMPAVQVILGKKGIVQGINYNGAKVIVYWFSGKRSFKLIK